jgi:dihydrodipicolinate synthase/N-acetylneuraminate lyase
LQAEANRVLELLTESENWSHRKAMVRFIGLDVGAARPPYEPLTDAQYEALAARMREQGIVRENDALKGQK